MANQGLQMELVEQRKVAQERGDVIGMVSHELRTPLTSIHGSLSLLKAGMGGGLNADGQRLLEVACRNSQRLVRLVNDVLDLERLESGTMTFNMRPFSLERLLEDAVEANSAYATPAGVTLVLRPVPAGTRVRVDGDQFLQVMANLLSNAVKFSPAGGAVEIETERQAGRVSVAVVDHGPGVPASARLFRPFERAGRDEADPVRGLGLGLALGRGLARDLGGDVAYEAPADGGARFMLTLPVTPKA